jgi:hypothetical protein
MRSKGWGKMVTRIRTYGLNSIHPKTVLPSDLCNTNFYFFGDVKR